MSTPLSSHTPPKLGGVKPLTLETLPTSPMSPYVPQFKMKPYDVIAPSSPTYASPVATKSRKRKLTLDELLVEITEEPDEFKTTSYFNASDLNQILKQKNIQLVPSKRLCRLVLESLRQQGALHSKSNS